MSLAVPCPFDLVRVGLVFRTSAAFGHDEMDGFADLIGDRSRIHCDANTAKAFGFPDRLQYGFLLAALLSRIVGTQFENAVCAAVSLDFLKPVSVGETVDAVAEVKQVQEAMRSVLLAVIMSSGGITKIRGKLTVVFLPPL